MWDRGVFLLLGAVGVALPRPSLACGGGVVTESGSVGADAQQLLVDRYIDELEGMPR